MWKLDERMNFSRYVYAFKFDILCLLEKLTKIAMTCSLPQQIFSNQMLFNENDPPKHPKDKPVGNNVGHN